MTVQLNGKPHALPAGSTVGALVASLGLRREGVAVAVAGRVVPRSAYDDHALREGDAVEIIHAVGGG